MQYRIFKHFVLFTKTLGWHCSLKWKRQSDSIVEFDFNFGEACASIVANYGVRYFKVENTGLFYIITFS